MITAPLLQTCTGDLMHVDAKADAIGHFDIDMRKDTDAISLTAINWLSALLRPAAAEAAGQA